MTPRIRALRPAAAPLAGLGMLVALMILEERNFDSASALLVALAAAVAAAELIPVPAVIFAFAALGFQAFGIFPDLMLSGATPYVCLPVLFFFAALGWDEPQRWPLPVATVTAAGLVTLNWFADVTWINFVFGKQLAEAGTLRIAVYAFLVFAAFSALNLAGWAAAASIRQAAANRLAKEQAETQLESTASALVIEQERNRIARELHDVLAHSLAVITAQAEGIRYVHRSEPELVEEAAQVIASSARSALQETRRLVQSFGSELEGPAPGAAELPVLVHHLQSSGMPVELQTSGLEGLSPVRGSHRVQNCAGKPHERVQARRPDRRRSGDRRPRRQRPAPEGPVKAGRRRRGSAAVGNRTRHPGDAGTRDGGRRATHDGH
ncbi:sensor histidine kinase [Paenarthrobacter sp. JL.01a]|uniref:sensor histidine kinase n=1 Tax=Paenarthrobacter sp. JL.01a TaxID=2979324 RepID=UPI0021C65CC3|nr:histidine kinase dimerization/phosphoacceptor domain-containing protein [Paenarthrobacter sp. JL.01a]UXM91144.1 histidine kinase dimerization/phosphoacceptor domain-containing protein [Paenarthrobacter sp. JL.01a]